MWFGWYRFDGAYCCFPIAYFTDCWAGTPSLTSLSECWTTTQHLTHCACAWIVNQAKPHWSQFSISNNQKTVNHITPLQPSIAWRFECTLYAFSVLSICVLLRSMWFGWYRFDGAYCCFPIAFFTVTWTSTTSVQSQQAWWTTTTNWHSCTCAGIVNQAKPAGSQFCISDNQKLSHIAPFQPSIAWCFECTLHGFSVLGGCAVCGLVVEARITCTMLYQNGVEVEYNQAHVL
jgi:hypothetical protein